jgi:hypothetical protein
MRTSSPTSSPTTTPAAPTTRGRGGPPLPAPAAAYAVLAVAAAVTYPRVRPGDDAATVLATLQAGPTAAAVSATLLVAAAAPLAVLTAAAAHRLRSLGARVAGPVIALVGGVLASASLLLSGVTGWAAAGTASGVGPDGAAVVRALTQVSFAAGAFGFALGSGLLLAGLSVPALILRLVPRPLAAAGVGVGVLGGLAIVGMLVTPLQFLLPVVRFGGLIVLAGLALTLPLNRRAARTGD